MPVGSYITITMSLLRVIMLYLSTVRTYPKVEQHALSCCCRAQNPNPILVIKYNLNLIFVVFSSHRLSRGETLLRLTCSKVVYTTTTTTTHESNKQKQTTRYTPKTYATLYKNNRPKRRTTPTTEKHLLSRIRPTQAIKTHNVRVVERAEEDCTG